MSNSDRDFLTGTPAGTPGSARLRRTTIGSDAAFLSGAPTAPRQGGGHRRDERPADRQRPAAAAQQTTAPPAVPPTAPPQQQRPAQQGSGSKLPPSAQPQQTAYVLVAIMAAVCTLITAGLYTITMDGVRLFSGNGLLFTLGWIAFPVLLLVIFMKSTYIRRRWIRRSFKMLAVLGALAFVAVIALAGIFGAFFGGNMVFDDLHLMRAIALVPIVAAFVAAARLESE